MSHFTVKRDGLIGIIFVHGNVITSFVTDSHFLVMARVIRYINVARNVNSLSELLTSMVTLAAFNLLLVTTGSFS